jgi:hypothetical protein
MLRDLLLFYKFGLKQKLLIKFNLLPKHAFPNNLFNKN